MKVIRKETNLYTIGMIGHDVEGLNFSIVHDPLDETFSIRLDDWYTHKMITKEEYDIINDVFGIERNELIEY